MSIAILQ